MKFWVLHSILEVLLAQLSYHMILNLYTMGFYSLVNQPPACATINIAPTQPIIAKFINVTTLSPPPPSVCLKVELLISS